MNSSKTILILVLVAVLAGGGYLALRPKTQTPAFTNESASPETTTETTSDESSFTGGIADLLKLGKNQQCDFTNSSDASTTTGRIYLANGSQKVRGDFTITQANASDITASIIQDGETAYYWTSAMPEGIKMKVDLGQTAPDAQGSVRTGGNSYANLQNNGNYKCKGWVVDNSKFMVPADIKFTDLTQVQNVGAY